MHCTADQHMPSVCALLHAHRPAGVPVWWKTTSVERPVFRPGTRVFFESLPDTTPQLPVTLRVTVITYDAPASAPVAGDTAPQAGARGGDCSVDAAREGQCAAGGATILPPADLEALRGQLQEELLAADLSAAVRSQAAAGADSSGPVPWVSILSLCDGRSP